MFDFHRWASWASEQVAALRQRGLNASYTLTEESKASSNPAFFVDVDSVRNVARIIVWSTGDFDVSVFLNGSREPLPKLGLPETLTDKNLESAFAQFVQLAIG